MPASLRFVIGLLAAAALLALGSAIVLSRQYRTTARVNAEQLAGGDSIAGKAAVRRLGCGACHEIAGIGDARGAVGPSLTGIADRAELAGRLANTPENLVRWIVAPQSISPGSGMPDQNMSDQEARNVAAYLYTLRKARPNR